MEQTHKPSPSPAKEEDVDLGRLFYKTGGAINSFFAWIGSVFAALGNFIILSLFFLRRNILWLAIGTILGIAYGAYLLNKNGNNYVSVMTVQTNYNSSRALYSTMDYLNALRSTEQKADLARFFGISEEEAKSLRDFRADAIENDIIAADLYKNRFLNLYHNTRVRMDTFWIKTITFKEFKNSLSKYDYPLHEVKVTSNNPTVFGKLQEGIVKYISSQQNLQLIKKSGNESNELEVNLLESSIRSLDTLRNSYNKRLSAGGSSKEGTSVTLLEGNMAMTNPELQLYDKMLQLKDELKMVRSQSVAEQDIIQVLSPFNAVGRSEGLLNHKVVQFAILGFLAALAILLLFALNKYLVRLEKSRKPAS
jgi:hypothetical protein